MSRIWQKEIDQVLQTDLGPLGYRIQASDAQGRDINFTLPGYFNYTVGGERERRVLIQNLSPGHEQDINRLTQSGLISAAIDDEIVPVLTLQFQDGHVRAPADPSIKTWRITCDGTEITHIGTTLSRPDLLEL